MATWAIGDIHGQYEALLQVLERSHFDRGKDTLISLGDLIDRGPNPFACILTLLDIPQRIAIRGNHDENFLHYIDTGVDRFHGENGMKETVRLWKQLGEEQQEAVTAFFRSQVPYFKDDTDRIYTHGGFDPTKTLAEQDPEIFAWDRRLWERAYGSASEKLGLAEPFSLVFIGHTPTLKFEGNLPIFRAGIWNLDTGAAYEGGRLTMMNVETEAYVQSDEVD